MSEDYSIFVGDLAPEVTDLSLQEHFRQYFPSVRSAKVITDTVSGRSKGYGFVRFANEQERDRALGDMQGQYLAGRPVRVSLATARAGRPGDSASRPAGGGGGFASGSDPAGDPNNTTLFIGGLAAGAQEDQLRAIFGRFGELVYVKIPPGKGCGFVQFVERHPAERAMADMNGTIIGNSAIRISWGRSSGKGPGRDSPAAAAAAGAAGYGYPGYSQPPYGYDPAAYAYAGYDPYAAYAAYGADPNAATYMGYHSAAYSSIPSTPLGPAVPTAASETTPASSTAAAPAPYNPLAPIDINKMNADYVTRHIGPLTGSFLKN